MYYFIYRRRKNSWENEYKINDHFIKRAGSNAKCYKLDHILRYYEIPFTLILNQNIILPKVNLFYFIMNNIFIMNIKCINIHTYSIYYDRNL